MEEAAPAAPAAATAAAPPPMEEEEEEEKESARARAASAAAETEVQHAAERGKQLLALVASSVSGIVQTDRELKARMERSSKKQQSLAAAELISTTAASFLPTMLLDRLDRSASAMHRAPNPRAKEAQARRWRKTQTVECVTLCIGLRGVHSLPEMPAQPTGEPLEEVLASLMSAIIDGVEEYGGEVVRITGEHVLAMWPLTIEGRMAAPSMQSSATEGINAACTAANESLQQLDEYILWQEDEISSRVRPRRRVFVANQGNLAESDAVLGERQVLEKTGFQRRMGSLHGAPLPAHAGLAGGKGRGGQSAAQRRQGVSGLAALKRTDWGALKGLRVKDNDAPPKASFKATFGKAVGGKSAAVLQSVDASDCCAPPSTYPSPARPAASREKHRPGWRCHRRRTPERGARQSRRSPGSAAAAHVAASPTRTARQNQPG